MSLLLDMVVGKVRNASPQEFLEFAEALGHTLTAEQFRIVEHILAEERERRAQRLDSGVVLADPASKRSWGI